MRTQYLILLIVLVLVGDYFLVEHTNRLVEKTSKIRDEQCVKILEDCRIKSIKFKEEYPDRIGNEGCGGECRGPGPYKIARHLFMTVQSISIVCAIIILSIVGIFLIRNAKTPLEKNRNIKIINVLSVVCIIFISVQSTLYFFFVNYHL